MARPPKHVQIGGIWIDVSVREGHGVSAEITDHPVESGANIADHIRPLPRTISIEGIVTNHPIELPGSHAGSARVSSAPVEIEGEPSLGVAGMIPGVDQGARLLGALKIEVGSKRVFSATVVTFTEEFDRVTAVHAALVDAVERRKLVTVVTGLVTYENVALTDLQIERSGMGGGDYLQFSVAGRVLRIVHSQNAKPPDPVDERGKPGKSRGKQAPKPATPAETTRVTQARDASALANIGGIGT